MANNRKIPTEDIATDCAQLNPDGSCEGLKVRECKGCKFWISESDYDWDKEEQCPKTELW